MAVMNLISLSQKGFISNGNWDMGKKLGIQIVKFVLVYAVALHTRLSMAI